MKCALIGLALCTVAGDALAGWYFVDPDGSDGAAGRSAQAPLATVNKALELAQPGDTVVLQPGIYEQDVRTVRAGRPGAPIRVQGPSDAIVRGDGNAYVIEIRHDFIELSGFTVDGHSGPKETAKDYRDKLVYIQGPDEKRDGDGGITGIRVTGMTLINARGECLRLTNRAHGNEIAHNTIRYCGLGHYRFDGDVKNGEAIYIGGSSRRMKRRRRDASSENHVHHNLMHSVGECIDVKEGAERNLIEHNACLGAKDPESGGISIRSNDNTIRHNLVGSSAGAGIRLGGTGETDGVGNRVYDNQLQYNREGALKIMRVPQAVVCGNEIRQPAEYPEIRFGQAGGMPVSDRCPEQGLGPNANQSSGDKQ